MFQRTRIPVFIIVVIIKQSALYATMHLKLDTCFAKPKETQIPGYRANPFSWLYKTTSPSLEFSLFESTPTSLFSPQAQHIAPWFSLFRVFRVDSTINFSMLTKPQMIIFVILMATFFDLNKQIGNITYTLTTCHTIILNEIISSRFRKDDGSSKGVSLTIFFCLLAI